MKGTPRVTRRRFVGGVAALLVGSAARRAAAAPDPDLRPRGTPDVRRLRMLHTHTDERLDVTYFEEGRAVPGALAEVDHFLRDFRTGDVHPIDPAVLDVAWAVACAVGRPLATLEIVSGYRSPATNALLRSHSPGVARHSMHLEGRAIDLRLRGVETARLRDAALALRRGGVGYYAASDFVHVDTGPVRRW